MRVLVSGANGFIGKALTNRLIEDDRLTVCELDRRPAGKQNRRRRSKVTSVEADLRDYEALRTAVQAARPDLIFHLAAAGVREPFLPLENALAHNLQGTIHLLRAAFEEGDGLAVKKVIVCRTPGERTAMNHYAASKAAAWLMCRMYARTRGWPIVGGMIFQVYGPGQSEKNLIPAAIKAAGKDQDFPMTEGSQARDWIFIEDVVRGLMALSAANVAAGKSVDIGSGRLTSVAEVVRMVYKKVGRSGQPLIGALPSRPGEEKVQTADAARTKRLIGWQSSTTLEKGLDLTIGSD